MRTYGSWSTLDSNAAGDGADEIQNILRWLREIAVVWMGFGGVDRQSVQWAQAARTAGARAVVLRSV